MTFFNSVLSVFTRDAFVYCLAIAISIIVARNLGPEILGIWIALSLISQYSDSFARVKSDIASVQFLGEAEYSRETILFGSSIIALGMSLILSGILLYFQDNIMSLILGDDSAKYQIIFLLIVACLPFEFLLSCYKYFYLGVENIKFYNKLNIVLNVSNLLLIIIFLLIFNLGIVSVVFAKFLSICVTLVMVLIHVHIVSKQPIYSANLTKGFIYKLIFASRGFYKSGLLINFFDMSFRTIGAIFLAKANLAFFTQAESFSRLIIKLSESVSTVLYPRISRTYRSKEAIKLTIVAFKSLIIAQLLIAAPIVLMSKTLIVFLYGNAFIDVASYLRWMILPFILFSSVNVFKIHIEGKGEAHVIPKLVITPIIISFLCSYFLTSHYGINGLIAGFNIGYLLYSLSLMFYSTRLLSIPLKELIITLGDIKIYMRFAFAWIMKKK
jgi:O-antigen/teichoic acid export membrane protein